MNQDTQSQVTMAGKTTAHDRHCFVVMPYGHTPGEIRWFKGWYDVVIKPAVSAAGYEPKLSAAEEQPNAINDEIRAHLAFDPMVVVDLGGAIPDAEPNPNVMYELGIRHALNLPVVMMSWRDQRLPFDVGNMRVIKEGRDLLDLETNRTKLIAFIRAAEAGQFYRPMEAVGRVAALEVASLSLSQDSVWVRWLGKCATFGRQLVLHFRRKAQGQGAFRLRTLGAFSLATSRCGSGCTDCLSNPVVPRQCGLR